MRDWQKKNKKFCDKKRKKLARCAGLQGLIEWMQFLRMALTMFGYYDATLFAQVSALAGRVWMLAAPPRAPQRRLGGSRDMNC